MKLFKVFTLVCLLLFFAACGSGMKKLDPEEATDGGNDISDGDAADTDSEPAADVDQAEPQHDGDPAGPETDGDTAEPVTDGDPAEPETDGDSNIPADPATDEEKCAAAQGTWDPSAQNCYKIEECGVKPENSEWNGDSTYKVYYDVDAEAWEASHLDAHYGDGEPGPCQYKCIADHAYENGECRPYCSAVFNGTSARIEVAQNDLLDLAGEYWTIEAWIKQADEDLTDKNVPIIRKGTTSSTPAYLLTGYKKQTTSSWRSGTTTTYSFMGYVGYSYTQQQMGPGGSQTKTGSLQPSSDVDYSDGWTHVALVQNKESLYNGWQTNYKLLLFVNGKQVDSQNYEAAPTINTVNEALVIGANLNQNANYFFKGLIDSVRISSSAKYTEDFENDLKALEVEEDTLALWDFSNNAADSSENHLDGAGSDITYSTDCAF